MPAKLGAGATTTSIGGSGITIGMSLKESLAQKSFANSQLGSVVETPSSKKDLEVPTALDNMSMASASHQTTSVISNLKQQVDPADEMSEVGASARSNEYDKASQHSHANLDNISVSQVSTSQYQQSESQNPQTNTFAMNKFSSNLPMGSSFGAGATIATNMAPPLTSNSMSFAGGLKFSQGFQKPAEQF